MPLTEVVAKMTGLPADYFGLGRGTLREGAPADVTVIDPQRMWTVRKEEFRSKSRNTPFQGRELKGRAVFTIVGGQIRHDLDGRAPKK
jgi:dihydroorotase